MDKVAEKAVCLGKGALLDIESAYRLIPGPPPAGSRMEWGDLCGSHAVVWPLIRTKIFNAVADTLEWYLRQSGIDYVQHYLDDFIVVGPPNSVSHVYPGQCVSATQASH